MIPYPAPSCKGQAVFGYSSVALAHKERTVNQASQVSQSEPPSGGRMEALYPARVYGYGTARYRAFVEALAEGLAEYEMAGPWRGSWRRGEGGNGNTSTPLPAA